MKNYNINFNYFWIPVILASGYIGSNFFYQQDEKNADEKIQNIILNKVNYILDQNNIYNNTILNNRKLFCNLDKTIFLNVENIYVETLLFDDELKNLLNLLIEKIKCIFWFECNQELMNNLNKIPNSEQQNELLNLINLSIKSLQNYSEKVNLIFNNVNELINTNLINDKSILNDLNFINKNIKKSFIKFKKEISYELNKLTDIINSTEWINSKLLEKIDN